MRSSHRSTLAATLALTLIAAACGGDEEDPTLSGDDAPGAPDASTPVAGASPTRDAGGPTRTPINPGAGPDARFASAARPPACDAPAPEPIYTHASPAVGLGVVDQTIYFGSQDAGAYAAPLDRSGPPVQVLEGYVGDLAVVGRSIYVSSKDTGYRLTPEQIASGAAPEELDLHPSLAAGTGVVFNWDSRSERCDDALEALVLGATGAPQKLAFPCGTRGLTGRSEAGAVKGYGVLYDQAIHEGSASGAPLERVKDRNLTGDLAAVGSSLVFIASDSSLYTDYLLRAPSSGGTAEVLAGPFGASELATDGKDAYVSDGKTHCVYRYESNAKRLVPRAKFEGVMQQLFVHGEHGYATINGSDCTREKCPMTIVRFKL